MGHRLNSARTLIMAPDGLSGGKPDHSHATLSEEGGGQPDASSFLSKATFIATGSKCHPVGTVRVRDTFCSGGQNSRFVQGRLVAAEESLQQARLATSHSVCMT